jgi:hypothetical protein
MTKEEWQAQLKIAQDNLNNLVKDARAANNIVNLTVVTDGPVSTVSLVSVTIV